MSNQRPTWQEAFRSCQTRVMFELKLSRAMLEFLCAASDDVYWDRGTFGGLLYPDNWVTVERALTKRGLIERKPPSEVGWKKENKGWVQPWKLTPVGLVVVEMLKVGGLFLEAEEARQKMAARKGRAS